MTRNILNTGIKLVKNVGSFIFGAGFLDDLPNHVNTRRTSAAEAGEESKAVYIIDEFFANQPKILSRLGAENQDRIEFVSTRDEPNTESIDQRVAALIEAGFSKPAALVGMGGGITLDTTKAVANLLTNGGKAEDYQGWDLVKRPGIYKIAIPTLSGTGAETTRTCVMTNKRSGLKLGMNSDFTVYDQLILDPELTKTVPRDQYFYTGMDAYIHCIESLNGSYRNAIGDAYSVQTIKLCQEVFSSEDMMSDENRAKLMVASYLGGCAIATSYVGVIHPFSAGLSVVLGLHHCVANCIVMRAMEEFYPREFDEFWGMAEMQQVHIPRGVCRNLTDEQLEALYQSTIIHEKPLTNALGEGFKSILTKEKVINVFHRM